MKTRIYIAGKVTGLDTAECRYKFAVMHEALEDREFKVINPMELIKDPETPWQDAMTICLAALDTCQAIYLLPCAIDSKGAMMELDAAIAKNLDIYYDLQTIENATNHLHRKS